MQIHVMVDGQQNGPYSQEEVQQYLATGQLQLNMPAWREGMADWQPLETFPEFAAFASKARRKTSRSRTPLYASLAVGFIVICTVAAWLLWHGKQPNGAEVNTVASPSAVPPSPAGGDSNQPKTLAELNDWYEEPPAGQNAALVFIQGYDAMKGPISAPANTQNPNLPFIGKAATPSPESPVPPAMKTAIAGFMQQNKSAWGFFKQASTLTQSRYPLDLTTRNVLLPDLARVKQATQVAEIFALGYADTKHGKEAGDSVFISYAIGRSLENEPLLISQLVRVAVNAITLRSLEQTVNRVALPPETLTELQDLLGRMVDREASGESFNRAFVGEMVSGLNFFDMPPEQLQKMLDSYGTNLPNDTDGAVSSLQRNGLKNAKADRQFFEDSWHQLSEDRKEPYPARLKAGDNMASRVEEAKKQQFVLSAMTLAADSKTTVREAMDVAQLRLAQIAVALERFRAAGGNHYPDGLDELSPKFLTSVPEDPFDGQPMRYAKSGNGYSLHSIGPPGATDTQQKSLTFTVSIPPKPVAVAP